MARFRERELHCDRGADFWSDGAKLRSPGGTRVVSQELHTRWIPSIAQRERYSIGRGPLGHGRSEAFSQPGSCHEGMSSQHGL